MGWKSKASTAPLHIWCVSLITDWGGDSRDKGIGICVVTISALDPPMARAKQRTKNNFIIVIDN